MRWKKTVVVLLSILFFISIYYLVVSGFTHQKISDIQKSINDGRIWLPGYYSDIPNLKTHTVILNFLSEDCKNCDKNQKIISEIKRTLDKKVSVLGVYNNNRYQLSKIIKNKNINYPIITDNKIFNRLKSKELILIDGEKYIDNFSDLDSVKSYLNQNEKIKEKYNKSIMSNPDLLGYGIMDYKTFNRIPVILTKNIVGSSIFVLSLNQEILFEIGKNNLSGSQDGPIEQATFSQIEDIVFIKNNIYVIDSGNKLLRKIDLKKNIVSTILEFDTYDFFPTGIEFYNNSIITWNKEGKILSLNLKRKRVEFLNNIPYISVGKIEGDRLYFIRKSKGSLSYFDFKKNKEFFIIQDESLKLSVDLLILDDIYYIDTYGNIHKYNSRKKIVEKLSKLKTSDYKNIGGLVSIMNDFYISDSYLGKIVKINLQTKDIMTLNYVPSVDVKLDSLDGRRIVLEEIDHLDVSVGNKLSVSFDNDDSCAINHNFQNILHLIEIDSKNETLLTGSYKLSEDKNIELPVLDDKKKYYLTGDVYCCTGNECSINKEVEKILIPITNGISNIQTSF